jgi:hypothetical protein
MVVARLRHAAWQTTYTLRLESDTATPIVYGTQTVGNLKVGGANKFAEGIFYIPQP